MPSTTAAKKRVPLWAAVFWILVWEAAARWVAEPIFLVSPLTAAARLFELMGSGAFWQAVAFTVGRIFAGFLAGCLLGVGLAALSYRFHGVRQLLSPLTAAIKAIPVASFVILALLWVSSQNLSILISALIGFPLIYANTLAGLDATDPKLIEMAKVFRVPFTRQLGSIYLFEVLPFLQSGMATAIGLCWKSGVAAEVIGIPDGSLGERLYQAKIYLETADLFAWTLTIVLLSIACEKLLNRLMGWLVKGVSRCWKQ